jgi:hypothetical protein
MQNKLCEFKVQKRFWFLLFLAAITVFLAADCGNNTDTVDKEETKQATASGRAPLVEAMRCVLCGKDISGSVTCRISFKEGKELNTCCSFCAGCIRMRIGSQPFDAVTVCYATGQKVDFKKAVFVVGSDEVPCCTPSVLAFISMEEAEKFVSEKNGRIVSYPEILIVAEEYRRKSK